MGGTEILIILGIMFVGGLSLLALSYIPYRYAVRKLAQSSTPRSPARLFAATLCMTLIWASVLALLNFLFLDHDSKGQVLMGFCATLGSLVFLLFLLLKSAPGASSGSISGVRERGAFQIWAQDLFIALLCYGAGLAILSALFQYDRTRAYEFLPWAAYVFLAGAVGFLFAVDFCRRQDWTQMPLKRATVFIAVFTFFPLILPLALLAWWRWRRALTLQANSAQLAQ